MAIQSRRYENIITNLIVYCVDLLTRNYLLIITINTYIIYTCITSQIKNKNKTIRVYDNCHA